MQPTWTSCSCSRTLRHALSAPPWRQGRRRGFTLIELLIVVAIIAILAAIAVPNFLEAQARAKVSRVHSDMRTLATGLETYTADNNHPPHSQTVNVVTPSFRGRLVRLTTPIAYLTSIPDDVFPHHNETNPNNRDLLAPDFRPYVYCRGDFTVFTEPNVNKASYKTKWVLISSGPDNVLNQASYFGLGIFSANARHFSRYDPTNGTISRGDVYRYGGESTVIAR